VDGWIAVYRKKKYEDINIKIKTKEMSNFIYYQYFHGPSLHTYFKSSNISGPSLLWSEFVIVRVCYALVATSADSVPSSNLVRITKAFIGTTFGNLQ
jgi:hypothetical protein